jgi:hypothetical protein
MIDAACLAVDEITGIQCSIINLQYAVKKMQFFDARMRVSWIIGSGIKPDQHAHAIVFRVPSETWIPGAASSHSGLAGASNGGTNG